MSANLKNDQTPVSIVSSNQHAQQPIYYLPPQPPVEDDEINLLDYWRTLMRFKWMIVLITFLSGASAIGAAFNMTPIYRAEIILAPAGEDKNAASALSGQFGGLAALAGINIGGGGGEIEQAIATLESRVFTNDFIKQEKLMPILFEKKWDASSKSWIAKKEEDVPTYWDAYKIFNKSIRSITSDKKTGMYTLAIELSDPELASDLANKLVQKINAHQKQAAIIESKKSIAYLESQLNETSVVEMKQAIYRLIEAQTKNIMLANVRDEFVFKVIDPAVVPEEKIKPKKSLIAVLGVIVGFMLSVFLAFFIAFIRKQKELSVVESTPKTGEL
ncbi:MAG: Wzz/FepE/Etk N-terminal domain-containing protein [Gammaproteobacteria bacterium]|nr:Wzz/FepE/Etk N-terminal domain-containing protein [Gammaproteobacteria bacterium]